MLHFDAIPDSVRNLPMLLAPMPTLEDFTLGGGTSLALDDWQVVKNRIRSMVSNLA